MTKASNTRYSILEKAFDLIYRKGYQTTSIDNIITTTQVTKGAFFYHFKTKEEMGIAIINEIIKPLIHDILITPLQNTSKPINVIYLMIKSLLLENSLLKLEYGCPVSNLTQEMTPWNSNFTKALNELILEWQEAIENCIRNGSEDGSVQSNVDPKQVAYFITSSYWGIRNFGKNNNNIDCYHYYLKELKRYLKNL